MSSGISIKKIGRGERSLQPPLLSRGEDGRPLHLSSIKERDLLLRKGRLSFLLISNVARKKGGKRKNSFPLLGKEKRKRIPRSIISTSLGEEGGSFIPLHREEGGEEKGDRS